MTVYVVMEKHLDVDRINGVFVSEVLAEKYVAERKINKQRYIEQYDWWIEKHQVIGE